ncbi:MAG: hypothetical protein IJE07_04015 [Clostridia bacterium]|nr:hypothetical protein [Clostridia bacterium]
MKRIVSLMLAVLMLLSAAPAMAAGGEISYAQVVDACMKLRALAHGDFMDIKGIPDDVQGRARDWTAGIDETPELVVWLDVYNCSYVLQYKAVFKSEHPMVSYEAQSTAISVILNGAMSMAAMETLQPEKYYTQSAQVNNALGSNWIYADAAAEDGGTFYVVLYEDALPVLILTNVENGAVSLSSYIIPSSDLAACTSYAEVAMWFMSWGCPMSGAEVKPE